MNTDTPFPLRIRWSPSNRSGAIRFWSIRSLMIGCLVVRCLAVSPAPAQPPQPDSPVDYQRQIRPILAEHCWQCHGVDDKTREGQLRLDLRDAALQGGDSGTPAIRPGDAAQSEMLVRLRSTDTD
ncbi:MAG: c-type cytochrome domain-containing protein, partial [Pirellulaceae bacterium]